MTVRAMYGLNAYNFSVRRFVSTQEIIVYVVVVWSDYSRLYSAGDRGSPGRRTADRCLLCDNITTCSSPVTIFASDALSVDNHPVSPVHPSSSVTLSPMAKGAASSIHHNHKAAASISSGCPDA